MNTDIVKGHWKEIKGKLQQEWGKFTNDDITQLKGTYAELEGQIQKKYGYEKSRAKIEIQNFLKKNKFE